MKNSIGILFVLSFVTVSCDNSTIGALGEAWNSYESQDYTAAYSQFSAIAVDEVPEAYVGLGWSALRLDSLDKAKTYFAHIAEDSLIDGYAGWSVADILTADFIFAEKHALAVLSRDNTYLFSHDLTVDYKDLIWNLAQSYYHQGQFTACLAQIQKLDPEFADPAPTALIQKLEDLAKTL